MSDWWRDRRRRRPYPWFDIFEEFDRMEEMMKEMMRQTLEGTPRKSRTYGPRIYGFSMSIGPDGKPVIRGFGNVQPGRFGPQLREEREPLIDIMEEKEDEVILAELPGVEKEDISLHATEDHLTISVDHPNRRYHKEMPLPAKVDPRSARASYRNGVLEVRLRKLEEKRAEGERIRCNPLGGLLILLWQPRFLFLSLLIPSLLPILLLAAVYELLEIPIALNFFTISALIGYTYGHISSFFNIALWDDLTWIWGL